MADSKLAKTDVLVLCTLTFGFGVLSSWAVFYTWGSRPQLKPIDLPAWTQAVGSIAAIVAAAAIATWQQRQQILRERRKENARALVAASLANTELQETVFGIQLLNLLGPDRDERKAIDEALEAVQIPDALKNLMEVAHEFPDEAPYIVRFFTSIDLANDRARTLAKMARSETIQRADVEKLFKLLQQCGSYGETVASRLYKITRAAG